MIIYGLTTEQRTEPLGLGETRPRLSWKLRGDRHGAAQTAYRITAAERATDLDVPARLVWDSGRRESRETLLIAWDGPALRSAIRYHWRVEVWDETGASAATAQSWFETGLLHREDWTAVWIGRNPVALPPVDPPTDDDLVSPGPQEAALHLRHEFRLPQRPVRARLYATARGVYEPQLNGERVGDRELAPGWTEYHHRIQYQTYDVTDQLTAGGNTIAMIVADGWWSGYVGFDPRRPARHYGEAPGLLAQLVVDFADGSQKVIATGSDWIESDGPIRSADLMMGQYVDARRTVTGNRPVVVLDTEPGPLVAEPDEPIRVTAELAAVSVERREAGRCIVDFGQNLVGRVRLRVRNVEEGRRIVLRHAEVLENGELYTENLRRAAATDVYVVAGQDSEVFEPQFTFHGFRYAEITGYTPADGDVTARVLHSDTPWTGTFDCDDQVVNQLHANIGWGQRGNFVAVPTDCPQRDERLGWLADAQVFAPTATRNADVSAFFARWMRDVVDGQNADGAFRDVAPIIAFEREGAPAWGDGGVIIPWLLWKTYGDRRVLEHSFAAMTAWVRHIHRHNPDLLWQHRTGNSYGDWLQIDADTPRDVLATAYFARSTEIVAAAADVLGEPSAAWHELHAGIKRAFQDAFVGDDGSVKGATQTSYLLGLAFDLVPESLKEAAVAHLAADIESRGNRLTTGFVGVSLLCPVLTEHGRGDLAYALLHQDAYPSWNYSIRHGATTIWERWDGWTEEHGFQSAAMNSFNHYSLGSVGDWLYGRVAGIGQTPASTAYSELLLRPTPDPTGRITRARASQETVRGLVECGWSREDGRLTVTATVPPGSTAILLIPTSDPGSVHAAGTPGVLRAEPSAGGLTVRLVSGRYTFTTPL
ncbi:putative alpha-L-rhamnosidase [Actinoplanes missouriensis 431]|uniref:alpha-L-rhamnosidase n=1 Tax=Actinoplanes missouriensis (strain ATCC 14538 / DSM 43046 / CBS 188.64 / JCM 3121 / NBRC 102363 / NCIMB 12654 / NRRL B-3342 / UNCC 431) TaxID=512565 RepID=I0H4B6_ACTM4|nr:alpha-L-rhamnosidase [Actinoplanes missouriensis]BAL87853.1 putative alpha-L-rhamnosidase [Actinoplanes missouriensis 431]